MLLQQKRPGSGEGRAPRGRDATSSRAAGRASSRIDLDEETAANTCDQLPVAPSSSTRSSSGDSAAPSQTADVQHEKWVAGVLSEVHVCCITGT